MGKPSSTLKEGISDSEVTSGLLSKLHHLFVLLLLSASHFVHVLVLYLLGQSHNLGEHPVVVLNVESKV